MSADAPKDLRYLQTHEWHRLEGDTVTIGITQIAADELTDITFVDLPKVGAAVSALLVAGVPQRGPAWAPLLAFIVVWALYLSIVNVGQIFYAFGWESLLLEAGFLVAFLGSDSVAPPALVIWLR